MAISDILLEGDSHLRHVSTIDKRESGLKSEDFRGTSIMATHNLSLAHGKIKLV